MSARYELRLRLRGAWVLVATGPADEILAAAASWARTLRVEITRRPAPRLPQAYRYAIHDEFDGGGIECMGCQACADRFRGWAARAARLGSRYL